MGTFSAILANSTFWFLYAQNSTGLIEPTTVYLTILTG